MITAQSSVREIYNRKKLELAITKANTNKEDYELKILEKQLEIERLQEEVERQKEQILSCKTTLENFDKPKSEDKDKKK